MNKTNGNFIQGSLLDTDEQFSESRDEAISEWFQRSPSESRFFLPSDITLMGKNEFSEETADILARW